MKCSDLPSVSLVLPGMPGAASLCSVCRKSKILPFCVPELNFGMDPDSNLSNHTYPVLIPFLENEITLTQMQKRIWESSEGRRRLGPNDLQVSFWDSLPSFHLPAVLMGAGPGRERRGGR